MGGPEGERPHVERTSQETKPEPAHGGRESTSVQRYFVMERTTKHRVKRAITKCAALTI